MLALTWGGAAGEAPSEVLFELSEAGEQVRRTTLAQAEQDYEQRL
ncbi:Uncharacterised protein [Bordetella pertussis]|nr:Uncharacterised protein [Bordetella pertussis]